MNMPNNTLIVGDCLAAMNDVRKGSVDLLFADPPFNIDWKYDVYDDKRERKEYLEWSERWIRLAVTRLKPNGTMWVAIGDEYAAEVKIMLGEAGLTMRNWVIWHYTFGVSCIKKFNRSHAHLLYFVKDAERFTFNPAPVRVASARMTTYNDKRAKNGGKLPDDTWYLRPQESELHFRPDGDTWNVSRVCGTFKERMNHPCQMPEAILERIVAACSNEGDLVMDPFAGSGTTLAVAKRMGRKWIGIELSEEYASAARQRVDGVTVPLAPLQRDGQQVRQGKLF